MIHAVKITLYLALGEEKPDSLDVANLVSSTGRQGYTTPDQEPGSRGMFIPHVCKRDAEVVEFDPETRQEIL